MSDAEKAYVEAQRLITKALADRNDALRFNAKATRALTKLPPQIADLTALSRLYLSNTQITDLTPLADLTALIRLTLNNTRVTDLTPLADLTALTSLTLNNTQITDLRPLLPLTKLADAPSFFGLLFRNTPATQLDPKLDELSNIEDDIVRATKTFAYLREIGDDWPPNHPDAPQPPDQAPAPIQAEFKDDVLVERPQPSDLSNDTANRARQGWKALNEFHGDVVETLKKGNLPNLERAINAFGRALGASFEDVRQIALGTHGQRIVEISKTAGDTLMDDAAGDLRAFAAAIDTHMQRFPEWVAYLQDDLIETAVTPLLGTVADELRDLSLAFQDTDFIASDLAQKFDDLVQAAEDKDLPDELAKKGVLRSLSNMLSPIAERAISATKKIGGDLGKEVYKKTIQGAAISVVGGTADILLTKGQTLHLLAQKYPVTLGWLESVLRYLGL